MLKITFFAIIYFAIILIYEMIKSKKEKTNHNAMYWLFRIIFYIYLLVLINVTIFPIPFQKSELENLRQNFGKGLEINFKPMKSIIHIINSDLDILVKLKQIGGNMILLFPLAFYLPLSNKEFQQVKKVFAFLLCCSCVIELVQFLIGKIINYNYRVVDIDDIILNVCGGMAGFFVWKILNNCILKTKLKFYENI